MLGRVEFLGMEIILGLLVVVTSLLLLLLLGIHPHIRHSTRFWVLIIVGWWWSWKRVLMNRLDNRTMMWILRRLLVVDLVMMRIGDMESSLMKMLMKFILMKM